MAGRPKTLKNLTKLWMVGGPVTDRLGKLSHRRCPHQAISCRGNASKINQDCADKSL